MSKLAERCLRLGEVGTKWMPVQYNITNNYYTMFTHNSVQKGSELLDSVQSAMSFVTILTFKRGGNH